MCDILILVVLCINLAKSVKAKNRSPVGYVFMTIAIFLFFECSGIGAGVALAIASNVPGDEEAQMFIIGGVIVGVIAGAAIPALIVHSLSDLTPDYGRLDPERSDWDARYSRRRLGGDPPRDPDVDRDRNPGSQDITGDPNKPRRDDGDQGYKYE
jgi:hypothetical protein